MKNMKVSMKLIAGFLLVAILTAIVGGAGIFGMKQIDTSFDDMYVMQTVPLPELGKAIEMLQRQRACMREFIIGAAVDDLALIEDAYQRSQSYRPIMYTSLDSYFKTIRAPEAIRLFEEARNLYDTQFRECMDLIYTRAKEGADPQELYALMRQYTDATNKIVDNFDACMNMKIEVAADAAASSSTMANVLLIVIIVILALSLGIAVFLAFYISGLISKPLITLTAFMKKAGTTGDISLRAEDVRMIESFGHYKDEIGQTISNCSAFIDHVTKISKELETIAGGDLTSSPKQLSDTDTMGVSLNTMLGNLNNMFSEINSATGQVSAGSKQIADGAQALAQGSTEQASSVEELAASLNEVSTKTNRNAEMAKEAASLSSEIKVSAEKGSRQMEQMMQAVTEINEAGGAISRVIKVIDDIAFQTNILALNAAVEAARAGQHGKGFAVVAEEVRNLAAKSAEAAKDTSGLIENSIEKANLGMSIAVETSESLKEIVSGINRNAEIIVEIEESSNEQADAIKQINVGIDQVAQVVQQNSATAEESAAASEEMSGQANLLQQLISQFRLKGGDSSRSSYKAPVPAYEPPKIDPPPMPKPAAKPKKPFKKAETEFVEDYSYGSDKY